jgi:hypothetical protein
MNLYPGSSRVDRIVLKRLAANGQAATASDNEPEVAADRLRKVVLGRRRTTEDAWDIV